MRKGFTLIELLIVVAIIAILAAIAVPNFLEAQTRAKVARVKTDMRSVATAIESYQVDNNHYPPAVEYKIPYMWGDITNPPYTKKLSSVLTTPVAYMSSLPADLFSVVRPNPSPPPADRNIFNRFFFFNMDYLFANPSIAPPAVTPYGPAGALGGIWMMFSVGPDLDEMNFAVPGPPDDARFFRDYDPTNGTVSLGNVFRTHRSPERIGYDPAFWMTP